MIILLAIPPFLHLQVRLKLLPILFFTICIITYTYVKLFTCSSYILSWLGYLPMASGRIAGSIKKAIDLLGGWMVDARSP